MTTNAAPRDPVVDALRALALAGVFVVNAVGYAQAPDHPLPLGGPLPAHDAAAQWLHGLLVVLMQAKAWPFLCFLFGYSLCAVAQQARARGLDVRAALAGRYRRLLLLGVLHGTLVYFGDILTAYAVCGLIAGRWCLARPARLLRLWRRLGWLVLAVLLYNAAALWLARGDAMPATESTGALVATHGAGAFWRVNAASYIDVQVGTLLSIFPMLLWLTLAGTLARRFRLLGLRRNARRFWARRFGAGQWVAAPAS